MHRLGVAGRTVLAIGGGYLTASAVGAAIAAFLIRTDVQARGPAVQTGTNLTFLVWAVAAMWAFFPRRQWTAWVGLLIPAVAGGAVVAVLGLAP